MVRFDRDAAELNLTYVTLPVSGGDFSMLTWNLHPRLRPFVMRAGAYFEPGAPVTRRELPLVGSPLILTNNVPYLLSEAIQPDLPVRQMRSFIAGMHDTFTSSRAVGPTEAIQVDLAPIAAHRFVRGSMRQLRNRLVPVGEILEGTADFEERLWNEPNWATRIRILEAELIQRLIDHPAEDPGMQWVWAQMNAGSSDIATLAAEVGWSQKHLIAKSHELFGMSPKVVTRLIRFQRAVGIIRDQRRGGTFADLAHRLGYFDQAHFSREFKEFAGVAPGEFVRLDRPQGVDLYPAG